MRIFDQTKKINRTKNAYKQVYLFNIYIYIYRFFAKPIIAMFEQTNKIKKENFWQQDR